MATTLDSKVKCADGKTRTVVALLVELHAELLKVRPAATSSDTVAKAIADQVVGLLPRAK